MANLMITVHTTPITATDLNRIADLLDAQEGDAAEQLLSSHVSFDAPDYDAVAREIIQTTDHAFSISTDGVSCIHCGAAYVRGMHPTCPMKG